MLTPKQVARAIGVSESSLKRWCDRGLIRMMKTAGGHRRLPIASVLDFLRTSGHPLVHPEMLGLPATSGQGQRVVDRSARQLEDPLADGSEDLCRQIVFDLYLARHDLALVCDEVIASAVNRLGDRWGCGTLAVYQERRACEIVLRILHEIRMAQEPPAAEAPLAMGGTPEGDPYVLPTTMVELLLRSHGWRAISLGSSLPFETLLHALREHRPLLFWLSVSPEPSHADFLRQAGALAETCRELGIPLVVGGNGLTEPLRSQLPYARYCRNLRELELLLPELAAARRLMTTDVPTEPPPPAAGSPERN